MLTTTTKSSSFTQKDVFMCIFKVNEQLPVHLSQCLSRQHEGPKADRGFLQKELPFSPIETCSCLFQETI